MKIPAIIMALLLCFQSFSLAENIRVDFVDASLTSVAQALAMQANINLVMPNDSQSQKKVTLHLKQVSPEDALDYVLASNGFSCEKKGNLMLVSTLPQDLTLSAYKKNSVPIELKYLSSEKAVQIINKIIPEAATCQSERANCLVIRGKESDILEIKDLIAKIDRPIPQILIEGKIIEVKKNEAIKFGLDNNNGSFKFINTKHEDIVSTVNALLSNGNATLVAAPRIATLDNHEAIINIGSRIPYAVPVSSSSSSTQWSIEYIDAGVKLKITPKIGKDNEITADIAPEVSSISEWRTTSAGEFPVISTRNAASTLRTKDGETIVVGGLDLECERENKTRTPIIGQIPFLNLIFANRTYETEKTEIVFLITPHII